MTFREFLKTQVRDFFIIVTLINLAIFTLGILFRKEQTFGYEAFLYPIFYAMVSLIPTLVTYSKKELSVKKLFFRQILQLILLEIILFVIGFGPNLTTTEPSILISFGLSIFIIFALVYVISYFLNVKEADYLTEMLLELQKKEEQRGE